ncbi:MAG: hypothetical protein ACLT2Z_06440 [Eubacterium sp.]
MFPAIAVCDGIAMMRRNEVFPCYKRFNCRLNGMHGKAHQFDALVMIPTVIKTYLDY